MSLDITPMVPKGRQLINSYGDGGFVVGEKKYSTSIMVFPQRTVPWSVNTADDITIDAILDGVAGDGVAILLVGCGPRFLPLPIALRNDLRQHGMVLEWMDTGAACRTFNVLLSEERQVAAALIAVE